MLSQIVALLCSNPQWLPLSNLSVKVEVFAIAQRPYPYFVPIPCALPLYPHLPSLSPVDSCPATWTSSLFLQHDTKILLQGL